MFQEKEDGAPKHQGLWKGGDERRCVRVPASWLRGNQEGAVNFTLKLWGRNSACDEDGKRRREGGGQSGQSTLHREVETEPESWSPSEELCAPQEKERWGGIGSTLFRGRVLSGFYLRQPRL